jgi:hypothetical protein
MPAALDQLKMRFERMTSKRATWESHWQDIKDYVNPDASDIRGIVTAGQSETEHMYDGTAPWALEQLASALQSFLTSPAERWFDLKVQDFDESKDEEVLDWLERVSDLIYDAYAQPETNHADTVHETYTDVASFGTAVCYQEWHWKQRRLLFRAFPLANSWIMENATGIVDTIFLELPMTTRQILQEYPDAIKIKAFAETAEKNPTREWKVIHAVYPREERDLTKATATNKAYASVHFCIEAKAVLRESGFDFFPFMIPRWTKRAGETYGRSPAMVCLPDVKMVNAMEMYGLKAIQKVVDPPLMVPDDGFIAPIDTSPGSLITYQAGLADNQMLIPLETRGRIEVNEEKLEQKRQHIMRCFYADWIQRFRKKERQSIVEVMDDRDEQLRLMSPILGRLQTELLGPMIAGSYFLLNKHDRIPPAPASIQGRQLKIAYTSPAAIAQEMAKGIQANKFVQELVPLAQIDPAVMDLIKMDELGRFLSQLEKVPRRVIRSPEEVEEIRAQRAQAQQAQAAAEVAEPASKAILNLAQAQESSGGRPLI